MAVAIVVVDGGKEVVVSTVVVAIATLVDGRVEDVEVGDTEDVLMASTVVLVATVDVAAEVVGMEVVVATEVVATEVVVGGLYTPVKSCVAFPARVAPADAGLKS